MQQIVMMKIDGKVNDLKIKEKNESKYYCLYYFVQCIFSINGNVYSCIERKI